MVASTNVEAEGKTEVAVRCRIAGDLHVISLGNLGFGAQKRIAERSVVCENQETGRVHIQAADIENYVRQFPRVLRPGGEGLIHHSKNGVFAAGWRSDMTESGMRELCRRHGLEVVRQFDSWDEGRGRLYRTRPGQDSPDIVTVFRNPG